eukprot:jgi/Mesvir1/908/Mv17470-RA.1
MMYFVENWGRYLNYGELSRYFLRNPASRRPGLHYLRPPILRCLCIKLRNSGAVRLPAIFTARPSAAMTSTSSESVGNAVFCLALVGDVMTGRLVDQLLPHPTPDEVEHGRSMSELGQMLRRSHLPPGTHDDAMCRRVWGTALAPLLSADVRILNLETSVTANSAKWPGKTFNYRMHPGNVGVLTVARVDYASLANNHMLDYQVAGMLETLRTLDAAGIAHAGAGPDLESAMRPAVLRVQRNDGVDGSSQPLTIAFFSLADHGCGVADRATGKDQWAAGSDTPGTNFVDLHRGLTDDERSSFVGELLQQRRKLESAGGLDMVVVSCHWGPNYSWRPSSEIVKLAHALVDAGVADLIHGHSSHHVQGIEIYKGKPILYGCGDFVDDYAVDDHYRNDLSFIYKVTVEKKEPNPVPAQPAKEGPNLSPAQGPEERDLPCRPAAPAPSDTASSGPTGGSGGSSAGVRFKHIELVPARCHHFQGRLFTDAMKAECWSRAKVVPGRHPDRWRIDASGSVVCRKLTSCLGCMCHEYDHILPFSKGGKTDADNCQILQSRVNRMKGNQEDLTFEDLRNYSCSIKYTDKELDAVEMAVYGSVIRPGLDCQVKSFLELVMDGERGGKGGSAAAKAKYKPNCPNPCG